MSQKNVEIVRGGFEAFNEGDVDAVVEMCDPEVEWYIDSADALDAVGLEE